MNQKRTPFRPKSAPASAQRKSAGPSPQQPAARTSAQRLQKALALAGLGSRRDMEALIESGRVTVNGQPARLGMSVTADDVVRIDKRIVRLQLEPKLPRVLLYHKPEGEIVSQNDPENRPTVFDKLPRLRGAKWVAVGRLDINSSGLMIFTTSGELANRFMHPRYGVEREYAVRVMGELNEAQMQQLTQGVELEDGPAAFDTIQDRGGEGVNHWYQVTLREGRNREVRRMFEAIGLVVSRLMRVRFGPVGLPPRLRRGQMLALDDKQVRELLVWAGLPVPRQLPQRRVSQREQRRIGTPFSPRARTGSAKAAAKPGRIKPAAAFDSATGQRRSDRNRDRG